KCVRGFVVSCFIHVFSRVPRLPCLSGCLTMHRGAAPNGFIFEAGNHESMKVRSWFRGFLLHPCLLPGSTASMLIRLFDNAPRSGPKLFPFSRRDPLLH